MFLHAINTIEKYLKPVSRNPFCSSLRQPIWFRVVVKTAVMTSGETYGIKKYCTYCTHQKGYHITGVEMSDM